MKTILNLVEVLTVALFCLVFSSFSSDNQNYQTECVEISGGYVTIKIWNPNQGAKYKPDQAKKDAIHALLFAGIAGNDNCYSLSPIISKTDEQEKFNNIEESFFDKKGDWANFTRSSAVETTLPEKIGDKNWKVHQVSVSRDELINYLKDQKIIKSLNNGF